MQPLLAALAAAGLEQITTREPSLEELFMSHYGENGAPSDESRPAA